MPFFTAILAYLFLKEKISLNVWISIFIATVGIIIMAIGNTEKNSLIGFSFWYYFIYWFFSIFSNT
jgi:drug/metabolite transporter (DMT)-like permease